jgi:transposase
MQKELNELIDSVTDVEILKGFSKNLANENKKLHDLVLKLQEEKFKKELMPFELNDQMTVLKKMVFGKSSEKIKSDDPSRSRKADENELLLHSQSLIPKTPHAKQMENLPEEIIIHEASDEFLKEEARSRGYENAQRSDWKELTGLTDDSTEVTLIERVIKKTIHKKKKYKFIPALKDETQESEIIVAAPGPVKLVAGAGYSADFAVNVVTDKYEYHLPLERQIRIFERLGLKNIKPKTLYNLCLLTATHCEPVIEKILAEILDGSRAAHCDETPWPITNEKDSDGYMWIVSNQAGSYYRFESTRSGAVIEEILKNYKGPVLNDGFAGYNRLKKIPGIVDGNCWSHARRKFFEIRKNYPTECDEILELMKKLFEIERKAKNYDELKLLREAESKVQTDLIYEWLIKKKAENPLRENHLAKAINYTLKLWEGLTVFLTDVRMPLTNNEAERGIRQSVMGRKNFYGSHSINGADVAAILYTVIESCKKAELQPKFYFKYVIKCNWNKIDPLTPLQYALKIAADKSAQASNQ